MVPFCLKRFGERMELCYVERGARETPIGYHSLIIVSHICNIRAFKKLVAIV